MSWRDKVQAMRAGEISQKCPNPSLPKTTETLFVVSVSTPPTHFQEKTGFSGHPARMADFPENLQKPATTPASPASSERRDPNAWRELATAYHLHHAKCHVCIAASKGAMYGLRCGAGAALWVAYQDAP